MTSRGHLKVDITHQFHMSVTMVTVTNNPRYDFKGALEDEGRQEDIGQRPGRGRKGNTYDVAPAPQQVNPAGQGGGVGSWDDSDAEERTLRDLNATLKKEKKRETEERNRGKKEQRDADRSQATDLPTSRSDNMRGNQAYSSGRSQGRQLAQQYDQPYEQDVPYEDVTRREVMSPYSARDVLVNMPGDKHLDNPDLLPVVFHDEEGARMLYHFHPCNMKMYEVPDTEDAAIMPGVADKAERVVRRLWQEVFGGLRLVTGIFIIFIVEALKFVFHHVVQPIIIGLLTGVGDSLLKPLFSLTFSLILQPIIVFFWNILTGVRHLSQPVIDILHGVLTPIAMVLRSFRLFDVTYQNSLNRPIRNV
ncbi:uncharacterized protein LOC124264545 isoform X2 [Haliotis rubra]|uniref:uncharacterized protein LOC124264545 isoform X2 n=1 Tax=Haliotis rubra TaxID=36100 RepID=UPI001EE59C0B|nr:uncharacterized protein LOC124264545 isoform X2 [Haliotis rubra]